MILFTLLIILTIFCLYRSIQPIYIYSTKEYYPSIISKSDYYIYKSMYNINIINNSDNTRSILHYKRKNNKKAIFWISGYCDYYYHYHIGDLFMKSIDERKLEVSANACIFNAKLRICEG